MNLPKSDPLDPRQCLSALMDGEADAATAQRGCEVWARDAQARRDWHAYHLIGDALRSEDLGARAAHDAAFLNRLRERLAAEPAVLAPQAPIKPARRANWAVPAALAAGVVVVAGVLVLLRAAAPGGEVAPALLAGQSARPAATAPLTVAAGVEGEMLRDARVDEYLRAHRATLAGSPVALPGGAMRNVELILPQR